MEKHKNTLGLGSILLLIFLGLVGLGVFTAMMLRAADVRLLNPKGLIAGEQLNLIVFSTVLLLTVAGPTVFLLYFVAWKYRESNTKATYSSKTISGKLFVFSMWAIPSVFMIVLAAVMLPATHMLEPQKPIAANAEPLKIQVIAMRWKWLFVYPEQNIASVNFVQIPVNTPVQFEITADESPMSSFWIPHLAGQLYAMTGHVNPLNLVAETTGDFPGSSAEINGAGFAGMKFIARASSGADFDNWVTGVKASSYLLDMPAYESLLVPSQNNPVTLYSSSDSDLYAKVLMKYNGPSGHHAGSNHGAAPEH